MMRQVWVGLTAVGCLVSSCSVFASGTLSSTAEDQIRASVVRIYYGDRAGQGTGFIVAGEPDVCTVVTSAHVVKVSDYISIETDETILDRPYVALKAEPFPGMTDLAIVTFDAPGEGCPYAPLPLGNSNRVRSLENLYIIGYPELDGRDIQQKHVMEVRVSSIGDGDVEGYAISYSGDTIAGMSGSPIVNARGQVVGIHGRANPVGWAIPVATLQAKLPEALASLPVTVEDSAEDFYAQGLASLSINGQYEAARQQFEQAVTLNPNYVDAWLFQGIALESLGRYEDALVSFDRAIQLSPDFAFAWYGRGVALRNLGRYEDALASHDRAIQLNPDFAFAWYNRGVTLRNLGRYEDALASHDRAIQLNPDYANAWYGRGIALGNLERYEDALASFDRVIELNPDDADVWTDRGVALGNLGRYEDALASFDRAIELNPDFALAWTNRGIALERLGRYEDALSSHNRAIQLNPDYSLARNNRGVTLERLGRDEDALASYDRAIELNPDYALAWHNRGAALMRLGRYEEALAAIDRALELDPNSDTQALRSLLLEVLQQ